MLKHLKAITKLFDRIEKNTRLEDFDEISGQEKALNLKNFQGQLEGIIKMIEEDRYCVDISKQIPSVQDC